MNRLKVGCVSFAPYSPEINSIAANNRPEATLLWRDQLALEPVHCRFGLHRVTQLHRRLKLMRATMTFKGP
jgi:hypothetical protein